MSKNKCKNCGASCDSRTEYCCDACARGENKHTAEPWNESTSEPSFKTNWPEALGYLEDGDRKRAIECVNALAGVEDVAGFMSEMKSLLKITSCRCVGSVTCAPCKALALFPTTKEEK